MKRLLRFTGQALVIIAITLALDYVLTATLFADQKRILAEADAANYDVYKETPYHHDLIPDRKSNRVWGNVVYPWQTDRHGFRIGDCAPGDAEKDWKTIFVIGDSFTEALGSSYEQSFVGLMACDAAKQKKAVWNLGVASYSPTIYHLKIQAAAERLGIKAAEIFVFLDLSDIDDEANVYRVGKDGVVTDTYDKSKMPIDLGQILVNNFTTSRFFYTLYLTSTFSYAMSLDRSRARWAVDPILMEKWGRRGLEVASANLDKVVSICREWDCRVSLVVYPWPDNLAAGDRDSIQVTYWRDWAAQHQIRFVDGFAPFFREPAEATTRKYFIAGDVHFTERGNRLLYETVKSAVGGNW